MTPEQIAELEALEKAATPGEWVRIYYDAGDYDHYDMNGPCPGIFSEQEDCGIIHWDGFKQKYWSSANGNQKQIEANADLIIALRNNLPVILAALKAQLAGEDVVERVAELQLAAFLAGRGSVKSMKDGVRSAAPAPSMDDFRRMAITALQESRDADQV